jgi:hypothetical protein
MNMKRKIFKITAPLLFLFPTSVFAASYTLLESINGYSVFNGDLNSYLTVAVSWVIGLATGLAVFMLVYSGFMMATTMGDTGRLNKAKEHIKDAAMGLLILAIAGLLLKQINPNLLNIGF